MTAPSNAPTPNRALTASDCGMLVSKAADGWCGEPCPQCKGNQFDNEGRSCGRCGGTGERYESHLDFRNQDSNRLASPAPAAAGGEVSNGRARLLLLVEAADETGSSMAALAEIYGPFGVDAARYLASDVRAALSAPPKPPEAEVLAIEPLFWKWLADRDLCPDSEIDGTVDWHDIIEALDNHERECLAAREGES